MKARPLPLLWLLMVAATEGAAVMAAELGAARLAEPHWGNGAEVWAAILSCTLGGLMIGYFAGGLASRNGPVLRKASQVLAIAGGFTLVLAFLSSEIAHFTLHLDSRAGLLITFGLTLLPLLAALGMVTPLLIGARSEGRPHGGEATGYLYALSTAGGIGATFLLTFHAFPNYGVKASLIFTSTLLFSSSLLLWLLNKNRSKIMV